MSHIMPEKLQKPSAIMRLHYVRLVYRSVLFVLLLAGIPNPQSPIPNQSNYSLFNLKIKNK